LGHVSYKSRPTDWRKKETVKLIEMLADWATTHRGKEKKEAEGFGPPGLSYC